MKRSLNKIISDVYIHTRSKKPKLTQPYKNQPRSKLGVVSATHVFNYMKKDCLVDWLKSRTRRGTRNNHSYGNNTFTQFILSKGIDFEEKLIKYIHESRLPVVKVSDFITDETCRKAIKLMKDGVPILHSVPVRNNYNKTQGVIDILIRSDYIHKIIETNPLTFNEQTQKAPYLAGDYHYIVIDIKFSTLPLRADGIHLLNSGHYPAYKAQTLIYTQAIGRIQGYTAPYAFILGRRWKYTSRNITERGDNCLNKLGKIDFDGIDKEYIIQTKKALTWVRDVKSKGSTWKFDPPSRPELYPNMSIDSGRWNKEKIKIADQIGELTSIWNIGIKQRNLALKQGITSWKNELCTSKILNIKGNRGDTIDKIISINRQSTELLRPTKISGNIQEWKSPKNELFVDFETLSDIFSPFDNLPIQKRTNLIFMIGVGWVDNGIWSSRSFVCKSANLDEEYRIMNEFMDFVNSRGSPLIRYWHAEKSLWSRAENRQFERACNDESEARKDNISDNWRGFNWCDLCSFFRTTPIVIKNCFKFGLKEIAKAMHKHKMINISLENNNCTSGMNAMISAWKCYNNSEDPVNSDTMKEIIKYNEFDCKVMQEILSYLRTNHS